jgi:hypothetical protein
MKLLNRFLGKFLAKKMQDKLEDLLLKPVTVYKCSDRNIDSFTLAKAGVLDGNEFAYWLKDSESHISFTPQQVFKIDESLGRIYVIF